MKDHITYCALGLLKEIIRNLPLALQCSKCCVFAQSCCFVFILNVLCIRMHFIVFYKKLVQEIFFVPVDFRVDFRVGVFRRKAWESRVVGGVPTSRVLVF